MKTAYALKFASWGLLSLGLAVSSCETVPAPVEPEQPTVVKSSDVDLPEVIIQGNVDRVPGGGGSNPPGGGGGPGGTGSGGHGAGGGGGGNGSGGNPIPPVSPTNPGIVLSYDGTLSVIRLNTCTGMCTNHIEATVKIENGIVTNVTSHFVGLTAGATYVQTDWVQNSVVNGTYNFSFAFHTNYSIPILGIGDLGSGQTAIAHCTYNPTTGVTTVRFGR